MLVRPTGFPEASANGRQLAALHVFFLANNSAAKSAPRKIFWDLLKFFLYNVGPSPHHRRTCN